MHFSKATWAIVLLVFLVSSVVYGVPSRSASALGNPQITVIDPPSPALVGTCVRVRARVDWDSEFRSMRMRFGTDGWQEEATPEFERTFCTGHLTAGLYTIRVEVARQGDNNWANPTSAEANYELTASQSPQNPSLTTNQTSVLPGQSISVSWSNFSPSGNDWISMHPVNTPDSSYLTWQYANGSSGSLTFTAPSELGRYEFRLFSNGPRVATSNAFDVTNQTSSPPSNPPVNPPPSNPTTGNTNPTNPSTGNTNPTNPNTGNSNPGVAQPSAPTTPLVGSTTPPQGQWVRIVASAGMNIRSGAGTSYPVVARAPYGVYLEYIEPQSGWYHVRWNGGEGWVSGGSQYTQVGGTPTGNPTNGNPNTGNNNPTTPSRPTTPQPGPSPQAVFITFYGSVTDIWTDENGDDHHYVDFLNVNMCATRWVVSGPLWPGTWSPIPNCIGNLRVYFSWPYDWPSPFPARAWRLTPFNN